MKFVYHFWSLGSRQAECLKVTSYALHALALIRWAIHLNDGKVSIKMFLLLARKFFGNLLGYFFSSFPFRFIPDSIRVGAFREVVNSFFYGQNFGVKITEIHQIDGIPLGQRIQRVRKRINSTRIPVTTRNRNLMSRSTFLGTEKKVVIVSHTTDFTVGLTEQCQKTSLKEIKFINTAGYVNKDWIRFISKNLISRQKHTEAREFLEQIGIWRVLAENNCWIVDWSLENAVILSHLKPDNVRLLIRIHRQDAFSWYPFLINWDRVDGIIFVSKTIANAFQELHAERLVGLPFVIARNGKFDPIEVQPPRNKVIALLQYAAPVKDVMFALELFKYFEKQDSEWRLVLAGPSFDSLREKNISKSFHEFISAHGLQSKITVDGYQNSPSDWFQDKGFILSSSLSEGSHEAVREGISNGCVPLIRNWPIGIEFGGAFGAYPELKEYIFTEPSDAYKIAVRELSRSKSEFFEEDPQFSIQNVSRLFEEI
jgi:hypothetical protein